MNPVDVRARLFCAMLFSCIPVAFAADASPLDGALEKMRAEHWKEAIQLLDPLPSGAAASLDAYLLAACWYHLGNPKNTLEAATRALSIGPPLEHVYSSSVQSMLMWASEALSAEQVKIHFEMSIPHSDQTELQKRHQENEALLMRVRALASIDIDVRVREANQRCPDLECANARFVELVGGAQADTPAVGLPPRRFPAPLLPDDKQARNAGQQIEKVER